MDAELRIHMRDVRFPLRQRRTDQYDARSCQGHQRRPDPEWLYRGGRYHRGACGRPWLACRDAEEDRQRQNENYDSGKLKASLAGQPETLFRAIV